LRAKEFNSVTLARILRPHGLRGEVAAEILTDFPERLPKLREVWLSFPASSGPTHARPRTAPPGVPQRVRVRRCWISSSRGGQAIFHFEGVDTVDAAEALREVEIQIPIEERPQLSAGNYYVSDLIGCEVWEAGASTALGLVRDVEFPGGVPLLAIETAEGEVLVPLAAEFCVQINVKAKRIEVMLPEGLRDLNRG
jgi:16S rRNA processing protein RimM